MMTGGFSLVTVVLWIGSEGVEVGMIWMCYIL